jgi:uncharacterized lipoprotein NlpE involved in copper resistance
MRHLFTLSLPLRYVAALLAVVYPHYSHADSPKVFASRAVPVTAACSLQGQTKDCKVRFFLQPFKGVQLAVDGQKVAARFSNADKTLAQADIALKGLPAGLAALQILATHPATGSNRIIDVSLSQGQGATRRSSRSICPRRGTGSCAASQPVNSPRVRCSFQQPASSCRCSTTTTAR